MKLNKTQSKRHNIRKVLIIDDDPIILELVKDALEVASFQVETAFSLEASLKEFYLTFRPDIIILDIKLGHQNGLDFFHTLDNLPADLRCPIILLSSNKQPEEIIEGLGRGAVDYFVKPPDLNALVTRCKILTAQKKKILVVDDDMLFAELVQFELRQFGFDSLHIADGNQVLHSALLFKPDLILLDRMMPGKEGLTIVRDLQQNAQTHKIPIIIVSAKRREEDIVESFKLHIDDYVTKPIRPKELVMRINRCLKL